jgi:ATP-dependent Clp protease ATP-binding subunit ClpA
LDESARIYLKDQCLRDLSNGGRGIRNQLEAQLVNPLARQIFDQDAAPGESFTVFYQADAQRLELVRD